MLVSELAGPELNYWVGRTEGKLSLELAAWFMFDNHTFHRCEGTLDEITQQARDLFQEDPDGLFGRISIDGVEITGLSNVHAASDLDGWAAVVRKQFHTRIQSYCTDWAIGGPIIEREQIQLWPPRCYRLTDSRWRAEHKASHAHAWGVSLLEAAMRCYVASAFGEDVPEPAIDVRGEG